LITLREQLLELGVGPGDVVLMHSSMKALGPGHTPEGFLRVLMETVTAEGTLLLPALTYDNVTAEQPLFSIADSEPCIGVLPRTFLHMEGVVRSMHPTHSVCAWGSKAEALTCRHILDDTPVGPNSPFMLLPEVNGKLLFVGDVLHACTFMHGIEEIAGAPYALNTEQTTYKLRDSTGVRDKKYYTHDFKGWEQVYTRIRDILSYPDIVTGAVGKADCALIDAGKLKAAAIARFREDVYAFVTPDA